MIAIQKPQELVYNSHRLIGFMPFKPKWSWFYRN